MKITNPQVATASVGIVCWCCTLCLWQIPNPATKHPFFIANDSKHICLCKRSKKKVVCQFFRSLFWEVSLRFTVAPNCCESVCIVEIPFGEIATWHKGVWSTHRERLLLACTLHTNQSPQLNRTEPRHNTPENDVATINVNIFTVVVVVAVVVVVDVVVIYNVHNICGPGKHLKYNGGKLVSFSSCL